MASAIIDVWDVSTFDVEILAALANEATLIRNYFSTDNEIFLSHDLGRGSENTSLHPSNPFASEFIALKEIIGEQMRPRTLRAWHYTRLTTSELEAMRRDGIHLSTLESLRTRLDVLVASGTLDATLADTLIKASPLLGGQRDVRSNKFWMVSHPRAIDDGGVKPLMAHWGGEVASMWMKDPELLTILAAIGKPRVLELAISLEFTRQSYAAGEAVIATYGRTLGCIPEKHAFDLYVIVPLKPGAVLAVHSAGDSSFDAMARGYPEGYIDVSIGHWKELTGEEGY